MPFSPGLLHKILKIRFPENGQTSKGNRCPPLVICYPAKIKLAIPHHIMYFYSLLTIKLHGLCEEIEENPHFVQVDFLLSYKSRKEIKMNKFIPLLMAILFSLGFLCFGNLSSSAATSLSPSGDEIPPAKLNDSSQSIAALQPANPGETLVFFFPTDHDASATVLYLLNTDTVSHIVALRGYSQHGILVYSLDINIGATSMLRLSSDSIASNPPPSWTKINNGTDPNTDWPIITNFTDFTYFASLSLPKGVKVDGYVLFNPGTGVVDPRQDQGAIPLRFMTQTGGVFLPVISR
jgi:hypothetical protein